MDLLSATRIGTALAMLAGAAILDLRTRRVPNGYWLPFLAAAAALLAVDVGAHGIAPLLVPLAVAAALCLLLRLLWEFRLFGGADAKGLMLLSILVPGLSQNPTLPTPFALDTLMNGTLLALLYPFALLSWNVARGHPRLPAALIGYTMPLARARRAHVWPMQSLGPDGRMRWRYWGFIGMDTETEYATLEAAGLSEVWVTAKVPLVALLACGAALAAVRGNLILELASWLATP